MPGEVASGYSPWGTRAVESSGSELAAGARAGRSKVRGLAKGSGQIRVSRLL